MNFFEKYLNCNGGIEFKFWRELYDGVFSEHILFPKKVLFIVALRHTNADIIEKMDNMGLCAELHLWYKDAVDKGILEFLIQLLITFKNIPGMKFFAEDISSLSMLENTKVTKTAQDLLLKWNNDRRKEEEDKILTKNTERVRYSTVKIKDTPFRGEMDEPEEKSTQLPTIKTQIPVLSSSVRPSLVNGNRNLLSPVNVEIPKTKPNKRKKRVSWPEKENLCSVLEYESLDVVEEPQSTEVTTDATPVKELVVLSLSNNPELMTTSKTIPCGDENPQSTSVIEESIIPPSPNSPEMKAVDIESSPTTDTAPLITDPSNGNDNKENKSIQEEAKNVYVDDVQRTIAAVLCQVIGKGRGHECVAQMTVADVNNVLWQYSRHHNDPAAVLISQTIFNNLNVSDWVSFITQSDKF